MLEAALDAARQIFTPPFRTVLFKILAITIGLLILVWIGLEKLAASQIVLPYPWLSTALSVLTGIGLFIGLAFIVAPTSSLVAGLYLDELAEEVEKEIDPTGPRGKILPTGQALWLALKFAGVSLVVNLMALVLLLVPGVNAIAFIVANAYLLGREYFELAALRYRPLEEVRRLRKQHALRLFLTGFFIAAFLAVPLLNLLTPLFGTAFMVRIHKDLMRREGQGALRSREIMGSTKKH
jgi:CysZ protein